MEKKECVYFFKHVGLSPIKIGFSTNESPVNRFNNFKIYAPNGAELIGFIPCSNAREIEKKLYEKYFQKRLSGEWFDITEKDCLKEIDFYTSKDYMKIKNEFQIAWAQHFFNEEKISFKNDDFYHKSAFNEFKNYYKENKNENLNKMRLAKKFNVSRQCVYDWIKKIDNE